MAGIFDKFGQSISNAVDKMASQMANLTNSYVYHGSAILNTGLSANLGQFQAMSEEGYFDYLKRYHFLSAVLDMFTSCIDEVIAKNKFECSITGDDLHTRSANKLLEDLQLKQFIRDNLRDMIYRGVFAFGIDYKQAKLYSLDNPYDVTIVTNTRDICGYRINNKFISKEHICCYYYKTAFESTEKKIDDVPDELKGLVVKYKDFKGIGLFNDKLARIFQLFALEYLLYYFGIRESMKPTLLSMSSGGKGVNAVNAVDMANQIEQLINEPMTGLTQLNDPTSYMNQLIYSMLNNVKVVPSIEQYNNISDINAGDLSQKREKLQQEKDRVQKEILSELTIPEQLFMGEGNRWETASRSDRFMTTLDNLLSSITIMVKNIISVYTGISTVSISFDLDTTMLVASYDTKNKTQQASEKMNQINSLMGEIKNLISNEYVFQDKAYDYVKTQIYAIDSKLGDIMLSNLDQLKNDDEDSENEDSSGGEDDTSGFGGW